MAYEKGVYEIDAETGVCAIYLVDPLDPTNDDPFTDPIAHRTRILYHSDLDYLEIFYNQDITLNLASFTAGGAEIEHAIPNHNLGVVPFCATIYNGEQIDGVLTIQKTSTGWRTLELVASGAEAKIYERRFGTTTNSTPAINLDITVRMLRVAPQIDALNSFLIDPENGVVQFGHGRFSTAGNPKVKLTTSPSPAYLIPKFGKSIDSIGSGLRICRPNGTNDDFWGYSGSFVNPGSWGVSE